MGARQRTENGLRTAAVGAIVNQYAAGGRALADVVTGHRRAAGQQAERVIGPLLPQPTLARTRRVQGEESAGTAEQRARLRARGSSAALANGRQRHKLVRYLEEEIMKVLAESHTVHLEDGLHGTAPRFVFEWQKSRVADAVAGQKNVAPLVVPRALLEEQESGSCLRVVARTQSAARVDFSFAIAAPSPEAHSTNFQPDENVFITFKTVDTPKK